MGVLPDDSPAGSGASRSCTSRSTGSPTRRGCEALAADLERVLDDVRAAVEDWKTMLAKVREVIADLDRRRRRVGQMELAEARAFLEWLAADHFTFLGYRAHDLVMKDGDDALAVVPGSGLGILREQPGEALSTSFSQLPPQVRAYARVQGPADHHQGELALDRAPAGLPRLHRHQALRRPRRGGRRAPLPRPLHPHRVPRAPERDPAPAAQGRQRAGEGGPRARRALVEVAREHPRHLPARRAVPDRRGRARRHRARHPASRRAPALPAVRPPRPVRALRLLPDLRAARALQHRSAPEVAGDPDRRRSTASRRSSTSSCRSRCSRAS